MLLLLPGMGAEAAMYAGPWRTLGDVRFLDWPRYQGETSIPALARSVVEECEITAADEIGGTSLGGMVALEIAAILGQRRVLLLSSAVSPAEFNPCLRWLAPLACWGTVRLGQEVASRIPGRVGPMLRRKETRSLVAMCKAIVRWEGNPSSAEVVRIHGARDWMIRCPPDAHVIPEAGHLGVLTHPAAFVERVQEVWRGSALSPGPSSGAAGEVGRR